MAEKQDYKRQLVQTLPRGSLLSKCHTLSRCTCKCDCI